MVKAIFIDFYGTVVHEDGVVIKAVTEEIISTGANVEKSEIDSFWWKEFQTMFLNADATKLSGLMFEHWMKPPIFEEAKEFFEKAPVPIYVVICCCR